jgi:hypothetical protein
MYAQKKDLFIGLIDALVGFWQLQSNSLKRLKTV